MSQDYGKIELIKTATGWSAKFSGAAAETVRYAFGSDTIPTAHTPEAKAKDVERQIRAMWPKCSVVIREGK